MTANKATTKENREDKGTRGPVQEDQHRNNWRPRKRESRERKKKNSRAFSRTDGNTFSNRMGQRIYKKYPHQSISSWNIRALETKRRFYKRLARKTSHRKGSQLKIALVEVLKDNYFQPKIPYPTKP